LDLPWGIKEKLSLNLPAGWEMTGRLEPASKSGGSDPFTETQRALSQPTGAARLSEIARGKKQVAPTINCVVHGGEDGLNHEKMRDIGEIR
jgi:hypothetical protein